MSYEEIEEKNIMINKFIEDFNLGSYDYIYHDLYFVILSDSINEMKITSKFNIVTITINKFETRQYLLYKNNWEKC